MSPFSVSDLAASPNPLAASYRRFRVGERILLSGHSHQAWPDRAFRGQVRAFEDAAAHVDTKWGLAEEQADRVRRGFRQLLDDAEGDIALGPATHDLVVKLLSALPLGERPRIVTTDEEFHSARRQLARLGEEPWVELEWVPAAPFTDVGARLAAAVDDRTALVVVSTVFFANARIAGELPALAEACRRHGAELLLDTYHQLNVVPFSSAGLEDAFVTGGGYKYCQLGEGNCFLRVPPGRRLRPVITGWFAEFSGLTEAVPKGRVSYGEGSARFAGATYEPTSHYRAAEVFEFFHEHGLEPSLLRRVSQHQVELLRERFDALDLPPETIRRDRSVPLEELGGFLALEAPRAGEIKERLLGHGVFTDSRGPILRLGPAPYLSDEQIGDGMEILGIVVREMLE